jgi:hypothetical protein
VLVHPAVTRPSSPSPHDPHVKRGLGGLQVPTVHRDVLAATETENRQGRGKCVLHVAGRTDASHARQKIPQPGNRASNLKLPLCDRLPIWSLNQGPLSITALSLDPFPLPMRHGSFETAENVSRHFYSLSHGIIGLPTVPSCSQGRCLYHWPRPLLGRPKPAGCVDCRASHQHR